VTKGESFLFPVVIVGMMMKETAKSYVRDKLRSKAYMGTKQPPFHIRSSTIILGGSHVLYCSFVFFTLNAKLNARFTFEVADRNYF